MEIVIALLLAWLPEVYFAATNLIHALAWGVWAVFVTVAAICLVHEQQKKALVTGMTNAHKKLIV